MAWSAGERPNRGELSPAVQTFVHLNTRQLRPSAPLGQHLGLIADTKANVLQAIGSGVGETTVALRTTHPVSSLADGARQSDGIERAGLLAELPELAVIVDAEPTVFFRELGL